jgi:hypothetical protein
VVYEGGGGARRGIVESDGSHQSCVQNSVCMCHVVHAAGMLL